MTALLPLAHAEAGHLRNPLMSITQSGPADAPKIQTMVGLLPVVAVVPKVRKGQRASDGVAALAIDFESMASP